MKQLAVILLLLVPVAALAQNTNQQDTTFFINNRKFVVKENENKIRVKVYEEISSGDTITNDQIFEGIYMDGQSTERRISLSVPFIKKARKSSSRKYFDPHVSGFYIGYYQMGDGFWDFGKTNKLDLVASKSWEWGIKLFESNIRLSRHFGLTGGFGFGYNSFRIDGNYAFREIEGITLISGASYGDIYTKSRLRYYHFRLPVSLEFQNYFGWRGPLFISAGVEAEARLWVKSIAKVNGKKQTLNKDLNVNPVGLNLLVQAGYGNWGFYSRYSMTNLFEKKKGPELYPYSFGIQWFW